MAHRAAIVTASSTSSARQSRRLSVDSPTKNNDRHSRVSSTLSHYFDAEEGNHDADADEEEVEVVGGGRTREVVEPHISEAEEEEEVEGPEYGTPPLSGYDSSAALILVHNDDDDDDEGQRDDDDSPFPFSDSDTEEQSHRRHRRDQEQQHRLEFSSDADEEGWDEDNIPSPQFPLRPASLVLPSLPPSLVFLHLLTPYLRLGALNLPYSRLSLKYGLPALLLSALTAAFVRQIWYLLARYLRKASLIDVVTDTFARSHGVGHGRRARAKERKRAVVRAVARALVGVLGVLTAIVYLRHAMYTLYPLLGREGNPNSSYVLSTTLVSIPVLYLASARALNYRRITYATWSSLITFLGWLACVIYAHSKGVLQPNGGWLGSKGVVPGLATTVFAFCSPSTLALYVSLKSGFYSQSSSASRTTDKNPYSRSFRFLSTSSAVFAMLLLLPLTLFSAFPNSPESSSHPIQDPHSNSSMSSNTTAVIRTTSLLNATVPVLHVQPMTPLPLVQIQIHTAIRILSALTLLLSIPSVLASTPPPVIPSPVRLRSIRATVSRVSVALLVVVLSCIPPARLPRITKFPADKESPPATAPAHHHHFFLDSESPFIRALILSTVLLAYLGTYVVPCALHVSQHFFKRPLAIILPRPPRTRTLSSSVAADGENNLNASSSSSSPPPSPPPSRATDELLLRKERSLQKGQTKKRMVWDVGVWAVLLVGLAGAAGFGVWIVFRRW